MGAENRCISCGCTESRACLVVRNGEMQGCAWVLLDRTKHEGLCSACASLEQLLYALLQPSDPLESNGTLRPIGLTTAELSAHTGQPKQMIGRRLRAMRERGLAISEPLIGTTLAWYRAEVG